MERACWVKFGCWETRFDVCVNQPSPAGPSGIDGRMRGVLPVLGYGSGAGAVTGSAGRVAVGAAVSTEVAAVAGPCCSGTATAWVVGGSVRGGGARLGGGMSSGRCLASGQAVGSQRGSEGDNLGQAQSGCWGNALCFRLVVPGQRRNLLVALALQPGHHSTGLVDLVPHGAQLAKCGVVARGVHLGSLSAADSQAEFVET